MPEREPPLIVGLETAVEMNLVQIGTNEFFPNSLFSILANHPLPHRKLNGFLFAMSTSRPKIVRSTVISQNGTSRSLRGIHIDEIGVNRDLATA